MYIQLYYIILHVIPLKSPVIYSGSVGYPLVNVYIAIENHHAINGKIHYFYDHFQ